MVITECAGRSREKKDKAYRHTNVRMHCRLDILMILIFPEKEYEKMSVTEKQQALLQGVVLEDSFLPETELGI